MHRTEGENNDNGLYTEGPPATCITADAMNSLQEEIAHVIEQAGINLLSARTDSRTQLWDALRISMSPYDYIVNSQSTFVSIIERVAANQYKFKNNYTSILFKPVTGGYSMVGVSSPLSGGDTWGYIETNDCSRLVFEGGTHINFASSIGYIKVDTDDCVLDGVAVSGDVAVAGAVVQSFLLAAHRVEYRGCKTYDRNSNVDFACFQGSGTALHNITSKYTNCSVYTIDGSDKIYGFKDCMNLSGCVVYDIDGTGDNLIGIQSCINLSNCYVYDMESDDNNVYGIRFCDQVANCTVEKIKAIGIGVVEGFGYNNQISACKAKEIDSNGGSVTGFVYNSQISACLAKDIDGNTGDAHGFVFCTQISACEADDIDSVSGVAEGFKDCSYGAALYTIEAINSGNDWIDTVDAQIVNKVSTPSVWT